MVRHRRFQILITKAEIISGHYDRGVVGSNTSAMSANGGEEQCNYTSTLARYSSRNYIYALSVYFQFFTGDQIEMVGSKNDVSTLSAITRPRMKGMVNSLVCFHIFIFLVPNNFAGGGTLLMD